MKANRTQNRTANFCRDSVALKATAEATGLSEHVSFRDEASVIHTFPKKSFTTFTSLSSTHRGAALANRSHMPTEQTKPPLLATADSADVNENEPGQA